MFHGFFLYGTRGRENMRIVVFAGSLSSLHRRFPTLLSVVAKIDEGMEVGWGTNGARRIDSVDIGEFRRLGQRALNRLTIDADQPHESQRCSDRSRTKNSAPKACHDWLSPLILLAALHNLRPQIRACARVATFSKRQTILGQLL